MANQSGVYTDVHDFTNKLYTFATANGWTGNKFVAGSGTSTATEAYLQNGTQYVNIKAEISTGSFNRYNSSTSQRPRVTIWGSTGFNSGSTIDNQPGTSSTRTPRCEWIVSPGLGYWFYTDGSTYINAVAETVANEFEHINFGLLTKAGSYTGGNYIDATFWAQGSDFVADQLDTAHSASFDSANVNLDRSGIIYVPSVTANHTNGWHTITGAGSVEGNVSGSVRNPGQCMHTFVNNTTPNTFNDASPLFPIHLFIGRTSGLVSPLGTVKDMRYLNIKYITPKDIITLGSDTYQVFPITTKFDPTDSNPIRHNSGYHGYAYKIVP